MKGVGLTEEDFRMLLACVAAAAKAMEKGGEFEEACKLAILGMKLTTFVEIDANHISNDSDDDPAFASFLRSMQGDQEGN